MAGICPTHGRYNGDWCYLCPTMKAIQEQRELNPAWRAARAIYVALRVCMFGVRSEDVEEKIASILKETFPQADTPYGGVCFICGVETSSLAGNPSLWPISLWPISLGYPGGNGKTRLHCLGCVNKAAYLYKQATDFARCPDRSSSAPSSPTGA